MVVLVKTSMNLNQDVVSAYASFKIAETIDDCEFPSSETIDFIYMGPIIAIGAVLIVTIIVLCVCWRCKPRTGNGFLWKINLNYAFRHYAYTVTCRLHKLSN